MKITMTKNLGSRDAARFGLKPEECQEGMTPDVSENAADFLEGIGVAEKPEEKAKEIKAIPDEPIKAKPPEMLKGKK